MYALSRTKNTLCACNNCVGRFEKLFGKQEENLEKEEEKEHEDEEEEEKVCSDARERTRGK
jgi:ferredoxin